MWSLPVRNIGDAPEVSDVIGAVRVMLEKFDDQEIDQLMLVSNTFINTMAQSPDVEQLLPLQPSAEEELQHHWDYLYEPDAKELLDGLLGRYIESQVYQAVVENNACEQAARMIAMKSAPTMRAILSTSWSLSITRPDKQRLPRNCQKLLVVLLRFRSSAVNRI